MFNVNDKIMPVEEILNEDEFTGRVEILRDLEHWISEIDNIKLEANMREILC